MATCNDCIHYGICIFHITENEYEKCPHYTPTADVVPKSEVEELKKKLAQTEVELMNVCLEKTNCDDMIQYILDFYFRQKVTEIFEEIERKVKASIVVHLEEINKEHIQDTPLYDRHSGIIFALRGIEDFIAELKKKYIND